MRLNQLYINACFDNDNKEEMPNLGLQPGSLFLWGNSSSSAHTRLIMSDTSCLL